MANDFAIIERALKLGESRSIKSQSKAYQEAFLALQSLRERFLEGMAFALESDPETSEAKSGEGPQPEPAPTIITRNYSAPVPQAAPHLERSDTAPKDAPKEIWLYRGPMGGFCKAEEFDPTLDDITRYTIAAPIPEAKADPGQANREGK